MMVLAINSFVVMLYRNRENRYITYIVVFTIVAYLAIMPLLAYRLRNSSKSQRIMGRINKGFRVFYTGISLTAIVVNMIDTGDVVSESLDAFVLEQQGKAPILILTAVMGFSCFWSRRLTAKVFSVLEKQPLLAKWLHKQKLNKEEKQ